MIGISKLYCGTVEPSDALRYGRLSSSLPSHLLQFSTDKRPVVVWNVTRRCNLKCVHCYAQATKDAEINELTTQEGKTLIDDLAAFGAPVLLFSGGEPLVRKDLPDLAEYAVQKGMRAVISTNGTLITPSMARKLKDIGLSYAGRGSKLIEEDLSHEASRKVVDLILERTKDLHDRGIPKEVLTVDNHADGPYLYLRLLKENPQRAKDVLELLQMNEGNSSGIGIGCISWDGEVYADQFWRHFSFGNVRQRPFSEIWTDTSNELMQQLKEKKKHVTGRCAECQWLDICGGNFRVRAEAVSGDVWAPDPACYLTDEEIGIG